MVKDPYACRSYLRCLLRLEDLLSAGKMADLPSGQPAGYYSCVLASEQPQLVPEALKAAEYKQILDSGCRGPGPGRVVR